MPANLLSAKANTPSENALKIAQRDVLKDNIYQKQVEFASAIFKQLRILGNMANYVNKEPYSATSTDAGNKLQLEVLEFLKPL